MAFFTQRWLTATMERERRAIVKRKLEDRLNHTASDLFTARGVAEGDTLYVIQFGEGQLHLIGRLVVAEVCDTRRAKKVLGINPWEASEHVLARPRSVGKHHFDLVVPPGTVRRLRFIRTNGQVSPPARNRHGEIGQQTFRGVREITAETAALFDQLLSG